MTAPKIVTLPELVKLVGEKRVAELVPCDRTLPAKWSRGQRPGWRNWDRLEEIAKDHGVILSIKGA